VSEPAAEVITLGECLISMVADRAPLATARSFEVHVAGAEANVAVGLARLGHTVAYIGRVGSDPLGIAIVRRLRGEGVQVEHLAVDPEGPTGLFIRELRELGPSDLVYYRSGSAGSKLSAADVSAADGLFAGARWLHVTGITPALSTTAREAVEGAISRARENGLTVSLDLNLRRKLWSEAEAAAVLSDLVARCDIVLGDLDEAALVTNVPARRDGPPDPEAVADALLALGPRVAVVKLGSAGALEHRGEAGPHRSTRREAIPLTRVVDPVGAGDAFTAGYIAATLEGLAPPRALDLANACGAAVASTVGDMDGLPTRPEVERILGARGPDVLR
jgi:2-dehydro-3-deoxygluconokinase